MILQWEGRACRGTSGEPGTCVAPGGCAMEDWIVCRERRPIRARHAVRALARNQAAGQVTPEREDELASAVAESAFGFAATDLRRYPPDRTVDTWVGDLVVQVLGERPWKHDGDGYPLPPAGWTWEALRAEFEVAAYRWARRQFLRGTCAEDLAAAALARLGEERRRGAKIRNPPAWAWRVFASLARAAARGKADGPLPPRIESRAIVAHNLAASTAVRAPDNDAALRELVDRAPALLDLLPPPYREIAHLHYLFEWSRSDIGAWLQSWHPVAPEGIKSLFRRLKEMLEAIGQGEDPARLRPGRFDPKRNHWLLTPRPPIPPL